MFYADLTAAVASGGVVEHIGAVVIEEIPLAAKLVDARMNRETVFGTAGKKTAVCPRTVDALGV